jgi:hypothetical protein
VSRKHSAKYALPPDSRNSQTLADIWQKVGNQLCSMVRQLFTDLASGPIVTGFTSPIGELPCATQVVGFDARFCSVGYESIPSMTGRNAGAAQQPAAMDQVRI